MMDQDDGRRDDVGGDFPAPKLSLPAFRQVRGR